MVCDAKNIRRCAVFLYFDKDGVVDDYNIFWLNAINQHAEKILIVCNGFLKKEAVEKFKTVTPHILFRRNEGMDVGGYKDGIAFLGYEELREYDEIILMNYTFYGPLYPLSEMFSAMGKQDIDFWGITAHEKVDVNPFPNAEYSYLPKHIQSYFLVLRHDMFVNKSFRQYWEGLKIPEKYEDSIVKFETVFTEKVSELGFKWSVYIDPKELEQMTYCSVMYYPKKVIQENRCPIIKRRSFYHDYMDTVMNTCGEASIQAYEYIRDNLDYDTNMIWDNILRLENMTDINHALHTNYFLSNVRMSNETIGFSTGLLCFVNQDDLVKDLMRFFSKIPSTIDVHVVCATNKCANTVGKYKNLYKDYKISVIVDEERDDIDSVFLYYGKKLAKEYDILGTINCSDVEGQEPYSNQSSWLLQNLKNTIGSEGYIQNILLKFQEEERLGLLSPFMPVHGIYYNEIESEWKYNYKLIKMIFDSCGISVNMSAKKKPIAPFGGCFWVRCKGMEKFFGTSSDKSSLFYTKNKKLHVSTLGTMLPFLLQAEGFYSGWMFSDEDAGVELTNLEYLVRETNKAVFATYTPGMLQDMSKLIAGAQLEVQDLSWKRKVKDKVKAIIPRKAYLVGKRFYFKIRGRKFDFD